VSLVTFTVVLLAVVAPQAPIPSTDAIKRTVIVDRGGFQAMKLEYAPGAADPAGEHTFDVVVVPIDPGMSLEIEGKPVRWQPGVAVLIPRGAPHSIRNASKSTVSFIVVHRLLEADIKPPAPPETNGVTIVRSTDSKYVRATTLRFERAGELRTGAAKNVGPSLFVLATPGDVRMMIGSAVSDFPQQKAGTVWAFEPGTPFGLINVGRGPIEIVRISAPPGRAAP